MNGSQNQNNMDPQRSEQLVEQTLRGLKGYVVVGKSYIRVWHAWLLIGIIAGLMAGVFYVANRSGQFQLGKAAEAPVVRGMFGGVSGNPQASSFTMSVSSEYNAGSEQCVVLTYPYQTLRITNGANQPVLQVPAGTPITRQGVPIDIKALKAGDPVSVEARFDSTSKTITAQSINALTSPISAGKIIAPLPVSTGFPQLLTLRMLSGETKTVTINQATKFFDVSQGVKPGTSSDLQLNRLAMVGAVGSGGQEIATWIAVQTGPVQLSGKIFYGIAGSVLAVDPTKQQVIINPLTALVHSNDGQPCVALSPFSVNFYNSLISLIVYFGTLGQFPPLPLPSTLIYGFTVPTGTPIFRAGQPISFSGLKPGDLINAQITLNVSQKSIAASRVDAFNTPVAAGVIKTAATTGLTLQTLQGVKNFSLSANVNIFTFSIQQGLQPGTTADLVANKLAIVGYIGAGEGQPGGAIWIIVQK